MARSTKPKVISETQKFIDALEFCAVAQKQEETDFPYQTHTLLRAKTAQSYDGILATGVNLDFADINTAAHTGRLIAALKRCKEGYSVTQTEAGQLVIKSGAFRALVPCLDPATLQSSALYPDQPTIDIGDKIKIGFKQLNPLVTENTQHVVTSSLLLTGGGMIATDRNVVVQYWHGYNMPANFVIPKAAITAIVKSTKPLVKLGYSDASVTFWFDDWSWIKTQVHSEKWPEWKQIFDFTPAVVEVPKRLVDAVEAVAPHSINGAVYLNQNEVASHNDNATGATHDCKGLPGGCMFGIKRLLGVLAFATHVDWTSSENGVYFAGDQIRAMLSKRSN